MMFRFSLTDNEKMHFTQIRRDVIFAKDDYEIVHSTTAWRRRFQNVDDISVMNIFISVCKKVNWSISLE